MLIVPDTNVIISAQLEPRGYSAAVLRFWHYGFLQFAVSEAMLAEYSRVLTYPRIQKRLKWTAAQRTALVDALRVGSHSVPGTLVIPPLSTDGSDTKFLTCAVEAHADAIVSGDEKHLQPLKKFRGIPILAPQAFVEHYLQQAA